MSRLSQLQWLVDHAYANSAEKQELQGLLGLQNQTVTTQPVSQPTPVQTPTQTPVQPAPPPTNGMNQQGFQIGQNQPTYVSNPVNEGFFQTLLADMSDDGVLNQANHANSYQTGLSQGRFSPEQIEQLESAYTPAPAPEPTQKPWYSATDSWAGPTGGVDWQKNAGMMGLDTNEFNKFQSIRQELVNNAYDGRISKDEFNQEWFKLLDNFGVDPVVQGTDKTYFLDPGLPGHNPYGDAGNIKGVFGNDPDLAGMYRRHAKTEGTDMPNEFSEIGPIVTAIAGGFLLGPAVAAKLGGGMLGAAGAGAGLTAANQALWGQDLDPKSIGVAALTSGALTGLDQFLNDGMLTLYEGATPIDVSKMSQAVNESVSKVLGENGVTHLMNPATGETVETFKVSNNMAADLVFNQGWVDVGNTNLVKQVIDGVSKIPGVNQAADAIGSAYTAMQGNSTTEGQPESVTYPSETFVDPTVDISTDPLTEEVMEESFDPGQVTIEETPDGEFVFVDVPPEFSPQETTQIGVPELPEPEGQGEGSGSGTGEGSSSEQVYVDGETDTEEDIFVDTITGEDTRSGTFEEVFVDTGEEEVFVDATPDEYVEVGLFDEPSEETVVLPSSGGSGSLRGLTAAGGSSNFDPFMAGLSYNPKMLAAINIELRDFLAELMKRG